MSKIRKLIDINKADLPYLEMGAARNKTKVKNMIEDLVHQVAKNIKQEEFISNVKELQSTTKINQEHVDRKSTI